jgi:DNA-binding transcriptional LysR family regulator
LLIGKFLDRDGPADNRKKVSVGLAYRRRSWQQGPMLYLIIKAALSGILIAIISEVAKRYPGFGGLIASLPLVSVLGMIWLWRDKPDAANMATHAEATFWFVLPSLPMFLAIPMMLRNGFGFWVSLVAGCVLTVALYALMVWAGPRFGLKL